MHFLPTKERLGFKVLIAECLETAMQPKFNFINDKADNFHLTNPEGGLRLNFFFWKKKSRQLSGVFLLDESSAIIFDSLLFKWVVLIRCFLLWLTCFM